MSNKEFLAKAEEAIKKAKRDRARSSWIGETSTKPGIVAIHRERSQMLSTLIYLAELGLENLKEALR